MIKRLKYILLTLSIIAGVGATILPATVGATAVSNACNIDPNSALCQNQNDDVMGFVKTLVNTLLYILGAVSVIVIIFGGIRYTTSMGDAKAVEGAKNTIMYAVIGLVVALLAFAIVNFVITTIK
jgi:hypothetical protein